MPQQPFRKVEMPNNLVVFIRVLIDLHRVGCPSHWIGDFLQSILDNNLVTAATPAERVPIPLSESTKKNALRKINLAPWRANLQVILAFAKEALPFSVALPQTYPAMTDINTYEATVVAIDLRFDPHIHM